MRTGNDPGSAHLDDELPRRSPNVVMRAHHIRFHLVVAEWLSAAPADGRSVAWLSLDLG